MLGGKFSTITFVSVFLSTTRIYLDVMAIDLETNIYEI